MRFTTSFLGAAVLGATVGCSSMAPAPPPKSAAANEPEATVPSVGASPSGNAKKAPPTEAKKAETKEIEGDIWGELIGDGGPGAGGLGLVGTGEGGGGIGLGSVGTLGHGDGTGPGQGSGSGRGRLGGHAASAVKISTATATTSGDGLEPEIIRRIVRRHLSQVKYCYETAMKKDPGLTGKAALKFTIDGNGAVTQASVGDTTIADADMVTCLVGVIKRMSFPAPENGSVVVVSYPLQFAPGE